jgi:hypothetical protein
MRTFVLCLFSALAIAASGEEEYVTRAEFDQFRAEFEKYKVENAKLKAQNTKLENDVEGFKAELSRNKPIDDKLNQYLWKPGADEYDAVRSGTTKLLISGWADAGFEDRSGAPSTFTETFHPVFLWKLSDRISFESDLDYVVLDYRIHDLLQFEAGRFLTPIDTFYRRERQTWINKLPDRPFVFAQGQGLAPEFSVGAMLDGAFTAGPTKFNWNAYVANGPRLITGDPVHFGELDFSSIIDNNQNKTLGGRLGFLPIPDLEVGGSAMVGRAGTSATPQSGVATTILGADMSYIHDFDSLRGTIDIRAEWLWSHVDSATYTIDGKDVLFTNNRHNGGYAQIAYRPTKIDQQWVRNLELVFRYDRISNPSFRSDDPIEAHPERGSRDRRAFDLNYWLGPSAVLKFAYENETRDEHAIVLQFAIGF